MKPFKSAGTVRKKASYVFNPDQQNDQKCAFKKQNTKSLNNNNFRKNISESSSQRVVEDGQKKDERTKIHGNYNIVGELPREAIYIQQVKATKKFYSLSRKNMFALADCDKKGKLNKDFVLLESLRFIGENGQHIDTLVCSCDEGLDQKERLSMTNKNINGDVRLFVEREMEKCCVHVRVANVILPQFNDRLCSVSHENNDDDDDETVIDQLSLDPLVVGMFDGTSYGVLSEEERSQTGRLRCRTCKTNVHLCGHIRTYRGWCELNEIDIEPAVSSKPISTEDCMSFQRIPYPLNSELKSLFDSYECGERHFPENLVPAIPEDGMFVSCKHKNRWDDRDPVSEGWLLTDSVELHVRPTTVSSISGRSIKLYFRPTIGPCSCTLNYDGQSDLLFNLDNKNIFYYGFLFQYLHLMIEGRNPLAAFHRAMTRSCAVLSNCRTVSYDTFRLGWNTFSRLLNISYVHTFKCEHCGPEPDIVICDGTFLGMRKDLIQPFMQQQIHAETTPIRGTKPKDRIFVKSAQTRKLLRFYSGKSVTKSMRGFRKVTQDKEMTRSQMKDLLFNLGQESPELYTLVKRLTSETKSRMVPPEYQDLFYELSLSSPAVGILQIGDDTKAKHLIKKICDHSLNLFDSSEMENLKYLKDRTPWLCRFLNNIKDSQGNIPADVTEVIGVFLEKIDNCFNVDGDNLYPPVSHDKLSFFPNLPLRHGNGIYETDNNSNSDDKNGCRKESYKHPKLTPGIFTVFCPHGICYGFQAMTSCESPKVPFMIFKTRFSKAPSVII